MFARRERGISLPDAAQPDLVPVPPPVVLGTTRTLGTSLWPLAGQSGGAALDPLVRDEELAALIFPYALAGAPLAETPPRVAKPALLCRSPCAGGCTGPHDS